MCPLFLEILLSWCPNIIMRILSQYFFMIEFKEKISNILNLGFNYLNEIKDVIGKTKPTYTQGDYPSVYAQV